MAEIDIVPQISLEAAVERGRIEPAAPDDADLPHSVLSALAEAPRYAEGTGIRLPVEDKSQVASIQTALKMARL